MAKANNPRTETHPRRRRRRKLTPEELEAIRREGEEFAEEFAEADRAYFSGAGMHVWNKFWSAVEEGVDLGGVDVTLNFDPAVPVFEPEPEEE